MECAPKSQQSNSTGVNGGHKFSVVKHGQKFSVVKHGPKVESLRKEWIRSYIKSKLWTQSRHETEAKSCVVVWSCSSSVSLYEM